MKFAARPGIESRPLLEKVKKYYFRFLRKKTSQISICPKMNLKFLKLSCPVSNPGPSFSDLKVEMIFKFGGFCKSFGQQRKEELAT